MQQIDDPANATTMAEYMYARYYGKGPHFKVFAPAIIMFCLMLLGYFGNSLIILATWRNRTLHGSCNYLLCMACFGDILHQSAHWTFFYVTVSGVNFIPYRTCLYFQTIPQLGVSLSIIMTLFVGLDRLVGVSMPTRYRLINTRIYMSACIGVCLVSAAYFYYVSYSFAFGAGRDLQVMCVIIDSLGGQAANHWFLLCVVLNIVDIVVYSSVWALIRCRTRSSKDAMMRRVFRSLLVIMFSVAFGWLVNGAVMGLYVPLAKVPVSEQYYWLSYFGVLPNLASATNFIPLYVFSQEYRQTFNVILSPIFPCLREYKGAKMTTVEPSKSVLV